MSSSARLRETHTAFGSGKTINNEEAKARTCDLLNSLYEREGIGDKSRYSQGKLSDLLGDVFEELTQLIFLDPFHWANYNSKINSNTLEQSIFNKTLSHYDVEYIESIHKNDIPKRDNGSEPKTDCSFRVNNKFNINLSIKQSTRDQVSAAEFSVGTMKQELEIEDPELIQLLEKHQRVGSGKDFSEKEKTSLRQKMSNIKEPFIRWVLSGSAAKVSDIRYANHILTYGLRKENKNVLFFATHPLQHAIEKVLSSEKRGYGTGLSWTYATGSKGKKVQFKCPMFK